MAKRKYRAIEFKQIQKEKVVEQVRGEKVVVAVDVAKSKQYGALCNEKKEVLQLWKWDQLRETRDLVGFLASLPAASVEVAMEPSGSYGDPLRHHLWRAGIPVYRVSPKRCKDLSEVLDGVPSQHDPKSAILVGRLHLDGLSELWEESSEAHRALATATRALNLHDGQCHQNQNRLEGQLARHWPELTQILALDSATLTELLAEYGGPAAVSADRTGAYALMRRVGRSFLTSEKIELVLATASTTLGVPMTAEECWLLRSIAQETRRNREERARAEKRLKASAWKVPAAVALRELLGEVTSVVVVSEADPIQSANPRSYVKSVGLNLKERSSGRYHGQLRITKRGSGAVRRWLYMAVLRLVQNDAVVREWYQLKVKRDGGLKKKALIAVMRKLVLAIWHVARGAKFDASKLFDVRRLKLEAA